MFFKVQVVALVVAIVVALISSINCRPAINDADPKVMCLLPPVRGLCRALIPRWSYDSHTKTCQEFKFGGCAGNANNFETRKSCMGMCGGI